MKVGIITMPLCANYGGTLQNWALQKVLIRMGHEPITFRFPVGCQGMSASFYWTRVFPKKALRYLADKLRGRKCKKPLIYGAWCRRVRGMERFVEEKIIVTEYLPNLSMEDVRRYGVEALIVGSDQIWRPVMYDAVKYYFLGFTKDSTILRIAYAPSIALYEWPFKEEITAQLRELIKNFSAISVREESSVKLIKDKLGVDAQWVLDPTMLLSSEDYLAICKNVPENKEPFVFAYILDMSDEKKAMTEKVAKSLGCSIKFLTADKVNEDDTIEKWLANFRDAELIITDSYHGTVFSLIFHKQFYCFYNTYRGNARMDSLKKLSGLDERFLQSAMVNIIDCNIDYGEIDKRFEEMRSNSIRFLEKALTIAIHII